MTKKKKKTLAERLLAEVRRRGGMRYTEMQRFVFGLEDRDGRSFDEFVVERDYRGVELRRRKRRGWWSTNLQVLAGAWLTRGADGVWRLRARARPGRPFYLGPEDRARRAEDRRLERGRGEREDRAVAGLVEEMFA